jgi:hypothetical protein
MGMESMPRQARIEAPSALHQITLRGIERKRIFEDDKDREDFLERLSGLVEETTMPCYAWALMPNTYTSFSVPAPFLLPRSSEASQPTMQ